MSTPCLTTSPTRRLADQLAHGLRLELDLTPKPGLVDRWNSGSHDDLNYRMMERSIALLAGYFGRCTEALENGSDVETLRTLGRETEQRMQEEFGTNTHRGAIFLGGLLLEGTHRAACQDDESVSACVSSAAKQLFERGLPASTTGSRVRCRYRVGGVIDEALDGLPAVFEVGVPALERGARLGMSVRDTLLLAMGRLMQEVEDTTTLRRCGEVGLRHLRSDGRSLEHLLLHGRDPIPFLVSADWRYRSTRMTMGGVADLLGISIAWHESTNSPERWRVQPACSVRG